MIDMWLSCALWCFCANRNVTDELQTLQRIAEKAICVTGSDLLYLWITIIAMLSTQLRDPLPFKDVIIHPVVCDEQGRKMSKSLGNVLVPNEIISTYGADCLRLSLIEDLDLEKEKIFFSEAKLKRNIHLLNKLQYLATELISLGKSSELSLISYEWTPLLNRLDDSFSKYNFQDAYRELEHHINHTLVEQVEHLHKANDSQKSLELLKSTLIALHPMIPFLTEWLWSQVFPRYPLLGSGKVYQLHSKKTDDGSGHPRIRKGGINDYQSRPGEKT